MQAVIFGPTMNRALLYCVLFAVWVCAWYGKSKLVRMVWYGTQHAQAISKEEKIKLEPSVATGCVDGSTPMVWYGKSKLVWYGMVKVTCKYIHRAAGA